MAHTSNLIACKYDDISKHTKVFNLNQIEFFTWIQLPKCVLRDYELFQIEEVLPYTGEISWLPFVQREAGRPWIQVDKRMLNLDIGKHIYKLSFVHKFTDTVEAVYVSYVIQDNKPETPYIYMNRSEVAQ